MKALAARETAAQMAPPTLRIFSCVDERRLVLVERE
jgi:hypothetical protein